MRYTIKEVMDYCSRNGISVYECWDEKDRRKKFYKMLIPVFESGVLIPVSNREYICSLKKAIKASTTGKAKRAVKKAVNPLYGKKGVGLAKNPKRAVKNAVYKKTTVGLKDLLK